MSKKKYNLNTIYISERLQENLKPISQSAFTAVTAPMGYGQTEQKRKLLCDPDQYLF